MGVLQGGGAWGAVCKHVHVCAAAAPDTHASVNGVDPLYLPLLHGALPFSQPPNTPTSLHCVTMRRQNTWSGTLTPWRSVLPSLGSVGPWPPCDPLARTVVAPPPPWCWPWARTLGWCLTCRRAPRCWTVPRGARLAPGCARPLTWHKVCSPRAPRPVETVPAAAAWGSGAHRSRWASVRLGSPGTLGGAVSRVAWTGEGVG